MPNLKNLSVYTKAGILFIVLGLLILVTEDFIWDESIQVALYLIPIGCFFSSFIAFAIAAKRTANN
jgi:hypothetical protein